jgi:hypothetical protein
MGNEIESINKIQPLQDVPVSPTVEEALSLSDSQVQPAAHTLSQVFEHDVQEPSSKKKKIEVPPQQQIKDGIQTVSFWNKFKTWLKGTVSTDSTSQNDLTVAPQPEPIQFTPVLEEPEIVQPDQPPLPPPPHTTPPLSTKELEEGLALLSEQSIEKMLEILLFYQAKIQEQSAEIAQTTFKRFQDLKKLQEDMLNDIKEVLKKDERFVSYFHTAQTFAFGASMVSGFFAALLQLGVTGQVVNLLGTVGPLITASATGLAASFKAYFQRRQGEEQAKHTIYEYKDQLYGNYVDEARERIFANVESSGTTQERLLQLMRNSRRKNKLMIRQMQP